MLLGELTVEVWDATGNKRIEVEVPDDVPVDRILLVLAETRVTDAGIVEVAEFAKLRTLDLEGLPITDDALQRLHVLNDLQRLNLTATKVTDAGVEQLRQVLPGLTVQR